MCAVLWATALRKCWVQLHERCKFLQTIPSLVCAVKCDVTDTSKRSVCVLFSVVRCFLARKRCHAVSCCSCVIATVFNGTGAYGLPVCSRTGQQM